MIVRVELPPSLERLRRRSVDDADDGLPAHITLLYPFVAPDRLDPSVREDLASVVDGVVPLEYALTGPARWPDTVYAAVEPARPFAQLQAALAAVFPAFPIYGRDVAFEFVPHVTIAEGAAAADPGVLADPGWRTLPRRMTASGIEVIAAGKDGRWRTVWRIRFGGGPLGRMPA